MSIFDYFKEAAKGGTDQQCAMVVTLRDAHGEVTIQLPADKARELVERIQQARADVGNYLFSLVVPVRDGNELIFVDPKAISRISARRARNDHASGFAT